MKYYALNINISSSDEAARTIVSELLADSLGAVGFEAFEDTPSGLKAYVQQKLYDEGKVKEALKNSMCPTMDVKMNYSVEEVPDENWNQTWEEEGFAPILIGAQCLVYDVKRPPATALGDFEYRIAIDPRQAFGSGTHQTTQMMLETLLDMNLEGKAVLDCGCGSGILGILAAQKGAAYVLGYDIDSWSVDNTLHNSKLNGVAIDVKEGDVTVLEGEKKLFDVVLANINLNIIIHDIPHIYEKMAPCSTLLLSGFYVEDANTLVEETGKLDLVKVGQKEKDNWCCLIFKKKG